MIFLNNMFSIYFKMFQVTFSVAMCCRKMLICWDFIRSQKTTKSGRPPFSVPPLMSFTDVKGKRTVKREKKISYNRSTSRWNIDATLAKISFLLLLLCTPARGLFLWKISERKIRRKKKKMKENRKKPRGCQVSPKVQSVEGLIQSHQSLCWG